MLDDYLFSRHLDEDEEVSRIVHKHWILGIKVLFWPILAFALGVAALFAVQHVLLYYAASAWCLATLVWTLRSFFDYYLDAWVITNHGIIDVAWHGWFHRESTRVLFSDVQGVSYEIQGVVGTILRIGTISIEKISTGSLISLDDVGNPRSVESVILKNMETYLHGKNLADAKHVQELLSAIVAREVKLKDIEGEDGEAPLEDDGD